MRVKVPFSYTCDVITSGGNEATRTYSETFEIDVPEVASADAPVALRWRGERPIMLGYRGERPAVPVDVRHRDGFLHELRRETRYDFGAEDRVEPLTAADLVACLEGTVAEGRHAARPLSTFFADKGILASPEAKWKGPPKAGTVSRRSWREDAREDALKSARKEAEGLLVVDGNVHVRVPEPVLLANADGTVWITSDAKPEDGAAMYRLDDLEAAVERVAFAKGKTVSQVARPPYELLDPSCLRRERAEMAERALVQVWRTLEGEVGRYVHTMPIPVIEAFYDMKEGISRHHGSVAPERSHPICAALCEAVRTHAPEHSGLVRVPAYDLARLAPALGIDIANDDVAALEGMAL